MLDHETSLQIRDTSDVGEISIENLSIKVHFGRNFLRILFDNCHLLSSDCFSLNLIKFNLFALLSRFLFAKILDTSMLTHNFVKSGFD